MKNGAMRKHKLARVHWQMGQTLLPEHFLIQEDLWKQSSACEWNSAVYPRTVWAACLERDAAVPRESLHLLADGGDARQRAGGCAWQRRPPALLAGGHGQVLRQRLSAPAGREARARRASPSTRTIHPWCSARCTGCTSPWSLSSTERRASLKLAVMTKNMEGVWKLGRALGPSAAAGGLQSLPGRDAARAGCLAGACAAPAAHAGLGQLPAHRPAQQRPPHPSAGVPAARACEADMRSVMSTHIPITSSRRCGGSTSSSAATWKRSRMSEMPIYQLMIWSHSLGGWMRLLKRASARGQPLLASNPSPAGTACSFSRPSPPEVLTANEALSPGAAERSRESGCPWKG